MYTSAMNNRTVRTVTFPDAMSKARWIDAMATLDARFPTVREFARRIAMAPIHDPNDQEALARDFHGFVRDSIRYVRDPAGEELSDSEQILNQGYGDCDDKARLFVALCRSIGIKARIRPCFKGEDFVHVQAEVFVGRPARWVLAELIQRDVALGEKPRSRGMLT